MLCFGWSFCSFGSLVCHLSFGSLALLGHQLVLQLLQGNGLLLLLLELHGLRQLRRAPLLLDLLCQEVGHDGSRPNVILWQVDGNARAVLGIHGLFRPAAILHQVHGGCLPVGQGVLHEVVAGDVAPLIVGEGECVLAHEKVVELVAAGEAGLPLLDGHAHPLSHGNALAAPAANEPVQLTVEEEAGGVLVVLFLVIVLVVVLLLVLLLLVGDILHGTHDLAAARAGALGRLQEPGAKAVEVEGVLARRGGHAGRGAVDLVKADGAGAHG